MTVERKGPPKFNMDREYLVDEFIFVCQMLLEMSVDLDPEIAGILKRNILWATNFPEGTKIVWRIAADGNAYPHRVIGETSFPRAD